MRGYRQTVLTISSKAWVTQRPCMNSDLRIAIKADANTPYSVIKK